MALEFHDKVAQLCLQHFDGLKKTGKPSSNEWTVLSCIVLENINSDHLEVVALGTGSKCIGRNKMSMKGDILNDSHAEVICRRAFLYYLYEEIHKCIIKESSVFTFDDNLQKFQLINHIKFHFFTTHVPCGDAAIFPKQDPEQFGEELFETSSSLKRSAEEDRRASKKICVADVNRTGAKSLPHDSFQDPKEESEYHVVGKVRTKPGRGDPTLSVSCSDKIMKWCHLGIQGALLSLLLASPIYLGSFTIAGGVEISKESLLRALYDRISNIDSPAPNERNRMPIVQSRFEFQYKKEEDKNPCPSSIVWVKNGSRALHQVTVEGIRQGITKKQLHKSSARVFICKLELFKKFIDILKESDIKFKDIDKGNIMSYEYGFFKNIPSSYRNAREEFLGKIGIWTIKDARFENFLPSTS